MFLPLHDNFPTGRLPFITIALILCNIAVYVVGMVPASTSISGDGARIALHDVWVVEYGAIPCEFLGRCDNQPGQVVVDGGLADNTPVTAVATVDEHPPWLTLLTSAFIHGGVLHLAFNMLFLWVYGNNVEDSMRPLTFLGTYLVAAVASAVCQGLLEPLSSTPQVGASGAIAAVIGGYLVLYPRARILSVIVFPLILWVPAWIVAGGWGLIQFFATTQAYFAPTASDGGVAYMAHLSGFVLGAIGIRAVARRSPQYARLYG